MECENFIEQRNPCDHKADLKPVKGKEKRSEIGQGEAQLRADLTVSANPQDSSRTKMVCKRIPGLEE